MKHGPVLLRTTAGTLWAVTAVTAFTGYDQYAAFTPFDQRMWSCTLTAAGVVTLAALLQFMARRPIRTYEALTQAILTRPYDRDRTGPMPAVITTGPLAKVSQLHGPRAVLGARRRPHGQHESSRSSAV